MEEEDLEYIDVVEAARRYQVNEKTIRRALHEGKFPARVTKNHKYEIAVIDLEAWRHPPASGIEQRMTAMEQRIQELEAILQMLVNLPELQEARYNLLKTYIDQRLESTEDRLIDVVVQVDSLKRWREDAQHRAPSSAPQPTAPPVTSQPATPIPPGTVLLYDFADQHGIARNEAERLWKTGFIAAKKIQQKQRRPGQLLLEARGQHDFWIQFHKLDGFQSCDQCPHEQT